LRELFKQKKHITTFGPYSPGQAVMMKRAGIEGIYLGGWATSAKGSKVEDPGPDLASYPLGQVPDEAAGIVRMLLAQDRNQHFVRSRMNETKRKRIPRVDYRPFIIADADTGHGGEAHVTNLVRRFVEAGVPGYHIEDQKPGVKKCGHQGGKVLVPRSEQNKRLNAARFQLDIMKVPGIIVARTDAEAATFLDGKIDERDHAFILGTTTMDVPSYKLVFLALLKLLNERGVKAINGHLLYQISNESYGRANAWMERAGMMSEIDDAVQTIKHGDEKDVEAELDKLSTVLLDIWQMEAGLKTHREAVADAMTFGLGEGREYDMTVDQWLTWAVGASLEEAQTKARSMGVAATWDCELPRTP
ncbi:MAG: isocitrate lyase/phosphoenolpyruvate mutase family protein, partial [Candidatus Krumholzibacteria bacterium]|nr:isocitrate lyase/phosphoenolpyruvate mutase family protein [Candidatus Krumholzibacteria bacterium]